MDPKERFLAKVLECENGCHEWQSTIRKDGYGKFWINGKQAQAHRAAWSLFKGEIPAGLWVLHKCDNRKCVNLNHLYLGTAKDNARDRTERCEWWGRMKYSNDAIQEIRDLYATGNYSQQALADIYGMHQTQVSRYVRKTQRI